MNSLQFKKIFFYSLQMGLAFLSLSQDACAMEIDTYKGSVDFSDVLKGFKDVTAHWAWTHNIKDKDPTSGDSILNLEKCINSQIHGIQAVVRVIITPAKANYPHHIRQTGLYDDDSGHLSYPVVDVYLTDGSDREIVIKKGLVLKEDTHDKWTGTYYKPESHQAVRYNYVPDLGRLQKPRNSDDHFQVNVRKQMVYRRPKWVGPTSVLQWNPDNEYTVLTTQNTLVPLVAKHSKFIPDRERETSQQWVKLFYPSDPETPSSTLVPLEKDDKEYLIPWNVEYTRDFLKFEYDDKKRRDRRIFRYHLKPELVFPATDLPPKDRGTSKIPVKDDKRKDILYEEEWEEYELKDSNCLHRNVYRVRGPAPEDRERKTKAFWS